ncbi:MAG: helix-turn-helix domain-containing protein, partial [Solirubrobacteraceae bacterium]
LAACAGVRTPATLAAPRVPDLTPRETEIALMVSRGLTNRQIAGELIISIRTVESCVLRSCRKLGAANRRELAAALRPDP